MQGMTTVPPLLVSAELIRQESIWLRPFSPNATTIHLDAATHYREVLAYDDALKVYVRVHYTHIGAHTQGVVGICCRLCRKLLRLPRRTATPWW